MTKIIKVLLAVSMSLCSTLVVAGEDSIFFQDDSSCVQAQDAKTGKYYTPALKRPAPATWVREKLMRDTCVQMDTVQGKFHVLLKEGTELAQNPKTGNWHHVLCTNWTSWKQVVPTKVVPCTDCGDVVIHTTTIKERLVVQCADGTTLTFDGEKKNNPTAECPKITISSPVEAKTNVISTTVAECKDCKPYPTQSQLGNLCTIENGVAKCRFQVVYGTLSSVAKNACHLRNDRINQSATIVGEVDGSDECCLRKEALLSVLKQVTKI